MKKNILILLLIFAAFSFNIKSMDWILTTSESISFKQWMKKLPDGNYLVHTISQCDKNFVAWRGKTQKICGLNMIQKNIESFSTSTHEEAMKKIEAWRAESEEKKKS